MRCLFKHHLLMNWNIENMHSSEENVTFRTKNKVSRRNNLVIRRVPDRYKWFYGFVKRKCQNNDWRSISLHSSDDALLFLQKTCHVSRCRTFSLAGAFKLHLKIAHSVWFNSLWCFVSWYMLVAFFLVKYYLYKAKPYTTCK